LSKEKEPQVRIAGLTLAVAGVTSDWTWSDREHFVAFQSEDQPDVLVTVHVGRPRKSLAANDLVHSVEGLRNVYLDQMTWSFEFCPYRREIYPQRPPYQVLTFDRHFTRGDLYVSVDPASEQPDLRLGLFLSDLLPAMLPSRGGLMVHAAGISDGGRGVVFAGHPGAGKSTLAALWGEQGGVRILNDDRTILRRNDGRWRVYSVPGKGDVRPAYPYAAELEAAFVISHSGENQARRLTEGEAAVSLLTHISFPQYDSQTVDAGLDLLEDLVASVPVYQLGFVPNQSAVAFTRELLQRGQATVSVRRVQGQETC
jgi:hypothetical protein